jgi:hypothetical protein
MEPIASMIVTGAERMLGLGEALLKDVPDEKFARFAAPGGTPIEANHPAFIYGHLSLYPTRIFGAAGLDGSAIAPSDRFVELFENGKVCMDDPDGSIYPGRAEIVDLFVRGHRAAIDAVGGLTDEQLKAEHTIEGRMAEMFPTVGHVASFLLVGHTMMHLGQMSTWRRAIGLGSAM